MLEFVLFFSHLVNVAVCVQLSYTYSDGYDTFCGHKGVAYLLLHRCDLRWVEMG